MHLEHVCVPGCVHARELGWQVLLQLLQATGLTSCLQATSLCNLHRAALPLGKDLGKETGPSGRGRDAATYPAMQVRVAEQQVQVLAGSGAVMSPPMMPHRHGMPPPSVLCIICPLSCQQPQAPFCKDQEDLLGIAAERWG